jgi:hypothetical protein
MLETLRALGPVCWEVLNTFSYNNTFSHFYEHMIHCLDYKAV